MTGECGSTGTAVKIGARKPAKKVTTTGAKKTGLVAKKAAPVSIDVQFLLSGQPPLCGLGQCMAVAFLACATVVF